MIGEMNKTVFQPSKSKIADIDAKYMILIAYLGMGILGILGNAGFVAWVVPLIIFFIDKENKFIAFHAIQAMLLGIISAIVSIILAIIIAATITSAFMGNPYAWGAGWGATMAISAIGIVVGIVILIFAILAMINGFKYQIYEIPLVGKWAEKIVFKTSN